MKDHLVIEENLNKKDIEDIYRIISQYGNWVNGQASYTGPDKVKVNKQVEFVDKYGYSKLSDIVYDRIDTRKNFHNFTLAKSSDIPMITRTSVGGYYKPHHDEYGLGDFSTTIFLNDNYEGGELGLLIDGKEKKFKLKAGGSVTYKTGTPHHVNKVTKGHRDVIVFWTHTLVKDPFEFEIARELTRALDLLEPSQSTTLENTSNDATFILRSLRESILRKSFVR